MYTSGTTGVPKGVLTTHRNLAAACLHVPVWSFDADTVSLTPLPMFHVGGIAWTYLALSQGATTIIVSEFDAAAVLDQLESERVTNAVFVPTILQMLTSVPGAASRDFSALRSIAYGASPITTPVLKAALRTFDCELFGVYGLTETTGGVVLLGPADHEREDLLRAAGRPSPWMELRVVDGEVWLRGPNVMAGYANRPAETAAALTDDGWLRTGDGGYLDEEGYRRRSSRRSPNLAAAAAHRRPLPHPPRPPRHLPSPRPRRRRQPRRDQASPPVSRASSAASGDRAASAGPSSWSFSPPPCSRHRRDRRRDQRRQQRRQRLQGSRHGRRPAGRVPTIKLVAAGAAADADCPPSGQITLGATQQAAE